jgi:hypothetical protein
VTEDFKDKDKEEAVKVNCCVCNKEHLVKKADTQNADQYWCNHDCYLKQPYPFPVIAPFSKKEKKVTETCPACGGPARGRGFTHEDGCSELLKKKENEKGPCPECGGPSQGRGWVHTNPNCSLKTKPYVPKNGKTKENKESSEKT